jgi:hypothetical protein
VKFQTFENQESFAPEKVKIKEDFEEDFLEKLGILEKI